MATYRIGIGSFSLAENGGVGIGTDSAGLGNLKVEGTVKTTGLEVSGVSTFQRYAGFAADDLNIVRDTSLTGEHSTLGDIVVGVNSTFTVSTGATVNVGTVESVSIGTHFSPPTGDRPEVPVEGTVRFNKDLNTLEFYNGVEWRQFTVSGASGRGYVSGGHPSTGWNSMEVINIPSRGNAVSFGVLGPSSGYINRHNHSQTSNTTRGLILGGRAAPVYTPQTIAFTLSTQGNTFDWGDLTQSRGYTGSCASSTRSVSMGGYESPTTNSSHNVIDYFEFSTQGNALDFGDLSAAIYGGSAASSPTRGFYIGGNPSPSSPAAQAIQSVTIASKGNAAYFGDLNAGRRNAAGFSNSVRAVTAAGQINPAYSYAIDYFTMASDGNAVHFGDVTERRAQCAGASNQTRGLIMGGYQGPSPEVTLNAIEYIEIMTAGNAKDFGDLYTGRYGLAASSDSHGGLGGY